MAERLHQALPYTKAEVIWAVRVEMARSVEDMLARRCRALFLDAKAASDMAPEEARLMAAELGEGDAWQRRQLAAFEQTASCFRLA